MSSIFKKIFGGISAAVNWLGKDDADLREARARALGKPDEAEPSDDDTEPETGYTDPWEEIDSLRYSMFLGTKVGRAISKHRYTEKIKKDLKKELEEIERKKEKDRPD